MHGDKQAEFSLAIDGPWLLDTEANRIMIENFLTGETNKINGFEVAFGQPSGTWDDVNGIYYMAEDSLGNLTHSNPNPRFKETFEEVTINETAPEGDDGEKIITVPGQKIINITYTIL